MDSVDRGLAAKRDKSPGSAGRDTTPDKEPTDAAETSPVRANDQLPFQPTSLLADGQAVNHSASNGADYVLPSFMNNETNRNKQVPGAAEFAMIYGQMQDGMQRDDPDIMTRSNT